MVDYFSSQNANLREKELADVLGRGILESEAMQRLRGVSFLGVLNIVANVPEHLRFTRYDHSISVAYLMWNYCKNLNIREDISLLVTLAALLHDVTHLPFSHSAEVYSQVRSGVDTKHTSALTAQKITKILKTSYSSLPLALRRKDLEDLVKRIYEILTSKEARKKYHPYITDVFDTPFCPDTFDGINRAWEALNAKEAKSFLMTKGVRCFEAIDPTYLVRFVSDSSPYPFIYNTESPPSKANLIYKFHDLVRVLYNSIIYSDWQTSAMVMFARTLEIAYADARAFGIGQNDSDVIEKIKSSSLSKKIYDLIIAGQKFHISSKETPHVYKNSIDKYVDLKKQKKSHKDAKKQVELTVAKELGINPELVFLYRYRQLVWSAANIMFVQLDSDKFSWRLKWDESEGEPDKEEQIEIYYMK